jgi:hypothetical protein
MAEKDPAPEPDDLEFFVSLQGPAVMSSLVENGFTEKQATTLIATMLETMGHLNGGKS